MPNEANNLLADNLFSPALLLAERIERGLVPVQGRTVIELGAGCGLPSMLAATGSARGGLPALVIATDYPDALILNNLRSNMTRNADMFAPGCAVYSEGFEWGTNTDHLLYVGILPLDLILIRQGLNVPIGHISHPVVQVLMS